MSDRLVKYKQLIEKHRRGLAIYWIDTDKEITADVVFDWLISELEQSRAEVKRLHENENIEMVRRMGDCLEIAIDRAENAEDELKECKAEVKRLRAMLAIGHFVIRE